MLQFPSTAFALRRHHHFFDLGDPEEIVKEIDRMATNQVKGPVLVEDISLCFNALKGPLVNEFATSVVGSPLTEVGEGATNLHVDHGVGDEDLSMAMNETQSQGTSVSGSGSITNNFTPDSFGCSSGSAKIGGYPVILIVSLED
ncbi:unnamed protein product [Lactuca saligna]|uniref:Uncharacterized protein n=1 Tax=Lactuca saligna TaxID=75948 RepID=A0AA35YIC7_LACSI|nr:unnamed protein product [Lactuca saligna]